MSSGEPPVHAKVAFFFESDMIAQRMRNERHIFFRDPYGTFPFKLHHAGTSQLIEWAGIGGDRCRALEQELALGDVGSPMLCSLAQVPELISHHGAALPALFIFHASRCGSSLAAAHFESDPGNRVFFEPLTLTHYLLGRRWEIRTETTRNLIAAHGLGAARRPSRLIIKFTSRVTPFAARIREAFPEVPTLFLYREPVEILASLWQSLPGYLTTEPSSVTRGYLGVSESMTLLPEELAARVVQRTLETVAESPETFDYLVNYNELAGEIKRVEGLCSGGSDRSQTRLKQKESTHRQRMDVLGRFIPDGKEKRDKASARLHAICQKLKLDFQYERINSVSKMRRMKI